MTRSTTVRLTIATLALIGLAACALAGQTSGIAFRSFTVEGGLVQGQLGGSGPLEWTGGVTVKGGGLTLTAESLKLWPTRDWRDADRIEATGNIKIEGRYLAADKTSWDVLSKAAAASYQRASAEGVLRGSVTFHATNTVTGAKVSAAADKMIYNFTTRQFRFERADQPVHMEWQEPMPPAAQPPPPTQPAPAKQESKT